MLHWFNIIFLTIMVLLIIYWIATIDFVKSAYSIWDFIKGVVVFLSMVFICSFIYATVYMIVVNVTGAR